MLMSEEGETTGVHEDASLLGGVGTSLMVIAGFAVLAFVLFVIEMLSYMC